MRDVRYKRTSPERRGVTGDGSSFASGLLTYYSGLVTATL
jgi:hypothetical protein